MGYKEHYSNSSNNDIQKEAEEIASIVYDYELIIKASLVIILLYTFISNIFNISSEVINNNLKLYAFISLMIILYVLYKLDIISLLKLLIILIVVSVILASIYYNLEKLEFLILFYYSFNYQLEKIYNETKTNYNEVLFSFIFIAIISIISIVLYWDNIYTDAKKLSKCGKIINTIENNNRMKKPFIYNIIIINNDLIDTTTSKYILKITYDFMKNKTVIDYGTDDGNYGDGDEIIEAQKELVFYYFNLRTMKSEKIANIYATVLNEDRFKYILVDDNNNKLPHDETAQDLIKFTKIYSKNENYNINIINDIFYAKNNREKLFI